MTVVAMIAAPRYTRKVPPAIVALAAGLLAYGVMALADPRLYAAAGNPLVIGPVGRFDAGLIDATLARWSACAQLDGDHLNAVMVTPATLTALLCIDTVKTCVVLDALTRSRRSSRGCRWPRWPAS